MIWKSSSSNLLILQLFKRSGIRGLYTGFQLHALRDTLGTGLYFSFYDTSRHFLRTTAQPIPDWFAPFVCGSTAGIASWAIICERRILKCGITAHSPLRTDPIDLVKAKVQRNALALLPAESSWSIFRRLSAGGVTKLYRGLGISATR